MNWESALYKRNGELRKQFYSWAIPKHIRGTFGITDGMSIVIKITASTLTDSRTYKVTSGGEIRLKKELAEKIEIIAKEKKAEVIQLRLGVVNEIDSSFNEQVRQSSADNAEARKARLANASKQPSVKTVTVVIYERNPDVVAEVLMCAGGKCEECGKEAPFRRKTDGSPYLEVHHKIRLCDEGDDSVANAVAMCPNCHRKAHFGE